MAFDRFNMALVSNPPRTNCPNMWTYITEDDNAAAVAGSGYFNAEQPPEGRLKLNDLIYCVSTDANQLRYVSAVSPAVTTGFVAVA